MAVSDALLGHLTTIYFCAIAAIKAYALVSGQSFTGVFVLATSTALVAAALFGALTWDLSRKAAATQFDALCADQAPEICRGGICWHGVAVRVPASQLRFRLPQHQPL